MEIGSRIYSVQRVKSTQKLPRVLVEWRENPRITAMATAIPTAAEKKLWVAGDHLAEIAHGLLGQVRLPVGIRGETDCRVPAQVLAHIGEARGIPREPLLEAQDQVGEEQADGAEGEH